MQDYLLNDGECMCRAHIGRRPLAECTSCALEIAVQVSGRPASCGMEGEYRAFTSCYDRSQTANPFPEFPLTVSSTTPEVRLHCSIDGQCRYSAIYQERHDVVLPC